MRPLRHVVPAGLLLGIALGLYAPCLGFVLAGDDYQWVQHAHLAAHRPLMLFADLDTFYRPANTWTLALDRLVWGYRPLGFHLTNLLLHGMVGIAVALVGRRLGLSPLPSWVLGALWVASPFAEEPAASVAIRFEDLLALGWLGLILAWPLPDQRWTVGRKAAVAACTLWALFCKETWVVTPALVWVLEWAVRKVRPREAMRTALPFLAAAVVYTGIYFLAFPGGKSYYEASLRPLLKVPHQLAAFLFLEGAVPVGFRASAGGMLALLVFGATITYVVRKRSTAGIVGAALLLVPMLPTLFVPYLPSRYTAVPYAGFLLLCAGAASEFGANLGKRSRLAGSAAAAGIVLLVFVAGLFLVRADLRDFRRVSDAHRNLLQEARAALAGFPLQRPILVVREETDNPLLDIARTPAGLPKLFFVRHPDPYGLVDAAALFEWVLGREDVGVRRFDDGERRFKDDFGAVLAHRTGGFAWISRDAPRLGEIARQTREAGLYTRVIFARPLSGRGVGAGEDP